jgi:hypothetical protein
MAARKCAGERRATGASIVATSPPALSVCLICVCFTGCMPMVSLHSRDRYSLPHLGNVRSIQVLLVPARLPLGDLQYQLSRRDKHRRLSCSSAAPLIAIALLGRQPSSVATDHEGSLCSATSKFLSSPSCWLFACIHGLTVKLKSPPPTDYFARVSCRGKAHCSACGPKQQQRQVPSGERESK